MQLQASVFQDHLRILCNACHCGRHKDEIVYMHKEFANCVGLPFWLHQINGRTLIMKSFVVWRKKGDNLVVGCSVNVY